MEKIIDSFDTIERLLTAVLAGGAVAAASFAWRNLKILRGQFRDNTFQILLKELAETEVKMKKKEKD